MASKAFVERQMAAIPVAHDEDILSAAARLAGEGHYADALEAAIEATRLEQLRKSSHRVIIAIHLAEGNGAEALRHYELFRDLLGTELGIKPSRQLTNMLPTG